MKNLILLGLFLSFAFVSCGTDKKESVNETSVEVKESIKYSVVLEAIYEKDDSLVVFYQKDKYFKYENPISQVIKGSPMPQKITINIPKGIDVENIKITASTNKEQPHVTINNVSILKNDSLVIDGSQGKHSEYFLTDETFSWDVEKSRYKLDHNKQYPPSLVGNDLLLSLLEK